MKWDIIHLLSHIIDWKCEISFDYEFANYDPKDGMCIQIFRGNEIMLLEKVAAEITSNATLFTTEGLLKDPENQTVLRDLIVKSVSSIFSH